MDRMRQSERPVSKMDGPDYPQDERPGTSNNVPGLIHDYRAQREAWREQARNLARMREEVLTAADREAKDIVSTARADIRRILLKARRDLLVLAAQVRAAGRLGEPDETPGTIAFLPVDDLGQVGEALTSARHDVRRVLDESRPELEGLAAEGAALRAALRQRPGASRPADVRRQLPTLVHDSPSSELPPTPVDFEFTTIATDERAEDLSVRVRRPLKAMLVTAATLGGLALMGTGWWLYRPSGAPDTPAGDAAAGQATSSPLAAPSAAKNAQATRTTSPVSTRPGFVSVNVAAKRSSWIRLTVDGRVTVERIFKAGETQQIRNARDVSIRAGDAGAVTVSVDGRQATPLGREGEVVTRRFAAGPARVPPADVSRPTPAPSASASVPLAAASPAPQISGAAAPAPPPATTAASVTTSSAPAATPSRNAETPPAGASPPPATVPTQTPAATARPATPSAPPAVSPASLQDALTSTTARWLDAYYRQDRATMAAIAPQANVSDDRGEKERLPRGLSGVKRSIEDVRMTIIPSGATQTAMLTARMTERMETAGQMASSVSFISNMWEQRNGSWQLLDVRIASPSSISRTLR
jgi:hypothetical protein